MHQNWRTRVASAALLLVVVAFAIRVASSWLSAAWPLLAVLGLLAVVYLLLIDRRR